MVTGETTSPRTGSVGDRPQTPVRERAGVGVGWLGLGCTGLSGIGCALEGTATHVSQGVRPPAWAGAWDLPGTEPPMCELALSVFVNL